MSLAKKVHSEFVLEYYWTPSEITTAMYITGGASLKVTLNFIHF